VQKTISWLLLLVADEARACPFCESATAEQVRAGLFDENFIYNFAAVLLPFPVLLLIIAWIHLGAPQKKRGPANDQRD
jgi:hypothetical protein